MAKDEEEYKKGLKAAGVDLEEEEDEEDEEEEESEDEEDESDDESEEDDEEDDDSEDEDEDDEDDDEDSSDEEDDDDEPQKPPKDKKKVSIYQAYKEKKKEARESSSRVATLEAEKAELAEKLKAFESADDDDDKEEAFDELESFAKEINADPEVIKKMRDLFNKGSKPDASLKKQLLEFQTFQKNHQKQIALMAFNEEFENNTSFLKEIFPKASKVEIKSMKTELEKLVHSKGEWNDKPLDFVIFRNKDKLSKLISPKKKGLESRERKDSEDLFDEDFDPNADLTEMSPKARAAWEKKYHKVMKRGSGLSKDSSGKKIII